MNHRQEYNRARWHFRLAFYVLGFVAYAAGSALVGKPVTGWWLFGLCAGVVLLELFLWINVGLPRAVKRGSDEFKRAYCGEDEVS